jgi:proteasome lid subunit RPN8/RPN11
MEVQVGSAIPETQNLEMLQQNKIIQYWYHAHPPYISQVEERKS